MIFDRQNFVSNCEQMQTWDCVYSIRPEHGEASPESSDQIPENSVSDGCRSVRCTLQPDPGGGAGAGVGGGRGWGGGGGGGGGGGRGGGGGGGAGWGWLYVCAHCSDYDVYCDIFTVGVVREIAPEVRARKLVSLDICIVGSLGRRECETLVSAFSVRLVFARSTIRTFIVTFLQSVWFGRSRQKFAPGRWCRRKLMSAKVCDTESCAGPSGDPSFGRRVVLCAFMTVRVQFDPGGLTFVTARVSRTPVSAQPQMDVIQLRLSSSRSGWLSLLSGAGMLPSEVSVSLQRAFLCIIRTIVRRRLRAQKGPLYDYACVRSEHTNGHQTVNRRMGF